MKPDVIIWKIRQLRAEMREMVHDVADLLSVDVLSKSREIDELIMLYHHATEAEKKSRHRSVLNV